MFQPSAHFLRGAGASCASPGRRTRRSPCGNRCDLLLRQRRVVGKMPVPRIGKPRRHHLHLDCMRHGARPRSRLLVGHERHRRNFSRTMAALAVILQNGQAHLYRKLATGPAGFLPRLPHAPATLSTTARGTRLQSQLRSFSPACEAPCSILLASSARYGVSMAAYEMLHSKFMSAPIPSSSAPANRSPSTVLRCGSCGRLDATCPSTARSASSIRCLKSAKSRRWPRKSQSRPRRFSASMRPSSLPTCCFPSRSWACPFISLRAKGRSSKSPSARRKTSPTFAPTAPLNWAMFLKQWHWWRSILPAAFRSSAFAVRRSRSPVT